MFCRTQRSESFLESNFKRISLILWMFWAQKSALNPKARKKDPALTDLLLQIMQDINDDWGEKAVILKPGDNNHRSTCRFIRYLCYSFSFQNYGCLKILFSFSLMN